MARMYRPLMCLLLLAAPDIAAGPDKYQQVLKLLDAQISNMNQRTALLKNVKDAASARAVAPKIRKLSVESAWMNSRVEKLMDQVTADPGKTPAGYHEKFSELIMTLSKATSAYVEALQPAVTASGGEPTLMEALGAADAPETRPSTRPGTRPSTRPSTRPTTWATTRPTTRPADKARFEKARKEYFSRGGKLVSRLTEVMSRVVGVMQKVTSVETAQLHKDELARKLKAMKQIAQQGEQMEKDLLGGLSEAQKSQIQSEFQQRHQKAIQDTGKKFMAEMMRLMSQPEIGKVLQEAMSGLQ